MSKVIGATLLVAVAAAAAGAVWLSWQESHRPGAEAWAAGTDRLRTSG